MNELPKLSSLCPDLIGRAYSEYSRVQDWRYIPVDGGRYALCNEGRHNFGGRAGNVWTHITADSDESLVAELRRMVAEEEARQQSLIDAEQARYDALPPRDPERQANCLTAIYERGDERFATRAIGMLRLDIDEIWPWLEDEHKDWLVEIGIVQTVEPEVTCTDAESWQSDWRPESKAAWPCYTIEIAIEDMDPLEVDGWHIVGELGPDGNWSVEDDDECESGLPRVDNWTIEDHEIPCWKGEDGRYYTLNRDSLDDLIYDAASDADHGDEPTWVDVDRDDMEVADEVYIVSATGQVVPVEILRGGVAEYASGDDEYEYMAEAWSHSLTDEVFETRQDAEEDLLDEYAHEEAQRLETIEPDAVTSLCRIACEKWDEPEDIVTGVDGSGFFVSPIDDDEEQYHLDADQAASLYHIGWVGVMDDIADAFGLRSTLASMRSRNETLDKLVSERDPFVCVSDSLAAGNCRQVTEVVRDALTQMLGGGEIGGIRASVLLAYRDDAYSRRAVRMAALRIMQAQ